MRLNPSLLVLSVLISACSATTSSRNIRTAGAVALIDVTSERDKDSVVAAEMVIGGASSNTYMILEGGDELSAEVGGTRKTMVAVGKGDYEARFPVSEGEFVVSFQREGDDDAPNSRGTMGPPFDIENAHGETPVSRASGTVTLTWSPLDPSADVVVELDGDCVIHDTRKLGGDTGTFVLAPEELRAWKSKKDNTCAVDVQVTRTRTGETDAALDRDSRIRLHQVRRSRFISAP